MAGTPDDVVCPDCGGRGLVPGTGGGHPQAPAVLRLLAECDRLRAVVAAHDLCHDLHGKVGPREFAAGCAAEQRKLYGCAPDADRVAELERLTADLADRLAACPGVLSRVAERRRGECCCELWREWVTLGGEG